MACHDHSEKNNSCHGGHGSKFDYIFWVAAVFSIILYFGHLISFVGIQFSERFSALAENYYDLLNRMSWGLVIGILLVGIIGRIPREYIISIMGKPGTNIGLLRATVAGLLLDLCNHGILLVGMKLYERGASLGQVMAFLIASPWNSLSLTIILVSLVGLGWTLVFIILSAVIALISGHLFDRFTKSGILAPNPHKVAIPEDFDLLENIKRDISSFEFKWTKIRTVAYEGLIESKMIVKWIFVGAILSSLIKVFVDHGIFQSYFGPSLLGLGITLIATTVIEVCSEGSTPLAADLLNRADAPGNAFTFLLAGVSTDYTEIMALRETTKSWKTAFFLPLITVPQVLVLGYILNNL